MHVRACTHTDVAAVIIVESGHALRKIEILYVCIAGYVRRSSATVTPELGNGKNQTLGRAAPPSQNGSGRDVSQKASSKGAQKP